jgi:SAM-dependent methyltransferase
MNAPIESARALRAASAYWERRARRFAAHGQGLAAVCSYGMPGFHNRLIDWCQRLALRRWLRVAPGARVLDAGCGVGRWTCRLATRRAAVTAVDFSPTMLAEARRRVTASGAAQYCRFVCADLAELRLDATFDLILGVTVLQHMATPRMREAIRCLSEHLAPAGRLVLLEAAPLRHSPRCDTAEFTARPRREYLELFATSGLRLRAVVGVDPAPFRVWLVPHLAGLPRPFALGAVALANALTAPVDLALGRTAVAASWHAVFVLERPSGRDHA